MATARSLSPWATGKADALGAGSVLVSLQHTGSFLSSAPGVGGRGEKWGSEGHWRFGESPPSLC